MGQARIPQFTEEWCDLQIALRNAAALLDCPLKKEILRHGGVRHTPQLTAEILAYRITHCIFLAKLRLLKCQSTVHFVAQVASLTIRALCVEL